MPLKILLVDDHKMTTDFYKEVLSQNLSNLTHIDCCNSLEAAYHFLFNQKSSLVLDYIILDLSMPAFEDKKIYSGEDLALLIREHFPLIKLIIITGYSDVLRTSSILKNVNPEGFIAKSDIGHNDFVSAFKKIANNEIYRSPSILKLFKPKKEDVIYFDKWNTQIILLVNNGIKTKNLPQHLPLSINAIDKRKAKIKMLLGIENGNDEDIIRMVKENIQNINFSY